MLQAPLPVGRLSPQPVGSGTSSWAAAPSELPSFLRVNPFEPNPVTCGSMGTAQGPQSSLAGKAGRVLLAGPRTLPSCSQTGRALPACLLHVTPGGTSRSTPAACEKRVSCEHHQKQLHYGFPNGYHVTKRELLPSQVSVCNCQAFPNTHFHTYLHTRSPDPLLEQEFRGALHALPSSWTPGHPRPDLAS